MTSMLTGTIGGKGGNTTSGTSFSELSNGIKGPVSSAVYSMMASEVCSWSTIEIVSGSSRAEMLMSEDCSAVGEASGVGP